MENCWSPQPSAPECLLPVPGALLCPCVCVPGAAGPGSSVPLNMFCFCLVNVLLRQLKIKVCPTTSARAVFLSVCVYMCVCMCAVCASVCVHVCVVCVHLSAGPCVDVRHLPQLFSHSIWSRVSSNSELTYQQGSPISAL